MTVKIRLAKTGKKGSSIFRIVAMPTRSKRDGQSIETLGLFDSTLNPPLIKIDKAKYQKWIGKGAKPSTGLRKILK
ncbi:MAG: 30S ribosomal protein S16 [bacterium]|nr:30S ribosomal protein S16 [bacterium]